MRLRLQVLSSIALSWSAAFAQDPPPIDDLALEQQITAACKVLQGTGGLQSDAALRERLAKATSLPSPRVAARSAVLAPPELYDLVRPSVLLVVIFYRCQECPEWHVTASTGFAVGADGLVATCAHVLEADPTTPTAFVAIADLEGHVWPVQDVVAADRAQDLCVLRCTAKDLVPLPLRAGARVGERIFCLSHPDHQFAMFTEGIVARWQQLRGAPGVDPESAAAHGAPASAGPVTRWLQITAPFATGSSGGPVVDVHGNVVGIAQSTTTIVHDPEAAVIDTQMVVYNASPASALLALLPAPAAK